MPFYSERHLYFIFIRG